MAVACTLLASGGFIGAGYVDTAPADQARSRVVEIVAGSTPSQEASPAGTDSSLEQSLATKISFSGSLLSAQKPNPPEILDLTSPNGTTPNLARSANAMRTGLPEIDADVISQVRKDILAAAYQGLGHSYIWGGTSFARGWDCSGFVQWAYGQAGIKLPRTEQWSVMIPTLDPQPGDLVVQNPDGPNHWSHVGIYIGDGMMISALNPSVGTILHTPGATSSSTAYFTMRGFAAADSEAAKSAASKAASAASASASTTPAPTPSPSASPTPSPSETSTPSVTSPQATPTPSPTPGATNSPTTTSSPTAPEPTASPSTAETLAPTETSRSATVKPAEPTSGATVSPTVVESPSSAPATTAPLSLAPGTTPSGRPTP